MRAISSAIIGLMATFLAHSETAHVMCQNSGNLGKNFAEARDNGMALDRLTANIEHIGETKGLSEDEVLKAKVTAVLVYSDKKSLTPDQIWKNFYSECLKGLKSKTNR